MDEGKSIRGQIDSCDHYFCFVCIMEWAKIESKCPMCKRRFTSIRRPPKDGVFPRERFVVVPKRDQIYGGFGIASSRTADPYAYVRCNVCQGTTYESLLLLCDLCDTASHTYCVGMGNAVPEGDWFCHDCTVLRDEHDNAEIETDTETVFGDGSVSEVVVQNSDSEHNNAETVAEIVNFGGSQEVVENSGSERSTVETVSDIVRTGGNQNIVECSGPDCIGADTIINSHEMPPGDAGFALFEIVSSIPHPKESFYRFWNSHPVSPRRGIVVLDNATSRNGRTDQKTADNSTELGARTLRRCRYVQDRIQAIRENWSALQNNSLRFSSIPVESGTKHRKRHNVSEVSQERSGQPCPSTSGSGQHLRSQDGSSCDSHDVEKAWKMMKTAKSMLRKSERASNVCKSSKNLNIKVNASKQAMNTRSSLHDAERQQPGNRSVMSDRRNQNTAMTVESSERLQSTYSTGLAQSPGNGKGNIQNQSNVYNFKGARLMGKSICGGSSSIPNMQGDSSSINLTGPVPGTSYSHIGEHDVLPSSSKIVDPEGKVLAESEARKYDHAKCEIQSLVKLNLKCLSRDKRLEYDAFKKVARLATHTILASCGLELPKSGIRFHPSSTVCSHGEHIKKLCKSTLMPDCCRECFYAFVKDVIRSIMFEKVDGTGRIH